MSLKQLLDRQKLPAQLRSREAKRIAAGAGAGFLAAAVYSIFAPNWYSDSIVCLKSECVNAGGS